MKVIDLLNKIANGEASKKIKYKNMTYHISYDYGDYESDIEEYRDDDWKEHYYLFAEMDLLKSLNDEVEIIEDNKKIEKLHYTWKELHKEVIDKINEIIDMINKDV